MPIYLYRCAECHQTCEALQHSSDAPLTECPHCHAQALHKIIAPCGVIFKGHGFYKTDNASSSVSESKPADHQEKSDTAAPAASSADSSASKKTEAGNAAASQSASSAPSAAPSKPVSA
ncbi:FmdB family transcriptional regulator [bacterium]|nr:FmdB family transcriptional regulator [bacterium]